MLNLRLVGTRFGHYGAAWLGSFLLVLVGDLAAGLLHMQLAAAADLFLSIALIALAVVFAVFVAVTLLSRESGVTKTVLLILGVLLFLPLLWAPVLGAIVSAFIGQVSIEYSGVYAGFRAVLGKVVFGVMRLFTNNPYLDAGVAVFQALATFLGFCASVVQLWQVFGAGPRRREAEG